MELLPIVIIERLHEVDDQSHVPAEEQSEHSIILHRDSTPAKLGPLVLTNIPSHED